MNSHFGKTTRCYVQRQYMLSFLYTVLPRAQFINRTIKVSKWQIDDSFTLLRLFGATLFWNWTKTNDSCCSLERCSYWFVGKENRTQFCSMWEFLISTISIQSILLNITKTGALPVLMKRQCLLQLSRWHFISRAFCSVVMSFNLYSDIQFLFCFDVSLFVSTVLTVLRIDLHLIVM